MPDSQHTSLDQIAANDRECSSQVPRVSLRTHHISIYERVVSNQAPFGLDCLRNPQICVKRIVLDSVSFQLRWGWCSWPWRADTFLIRLIVVHVVVDVCPGHLTPKRAIRNDVQTPAPGVIPMIFRRNPSNSLQKHRGVSPSIHRIPSERMGIA